MTATIKSTHSGLWQGKLNVYTTVNDTSRHQVYSEQFIVIWMNPTQPTITESSVSSLSYPGGSTVDQLSTTASRPRPAARRSTLTSGLPLSGPFNETGYLGDPSGNGMFNPSLWPTCDKGRDNCKEESTVTGATTAGEQQRPDRHPRFGHVPGRGSRPPATTNQKFFGSIDGGVNPGLITLPVQWPALAGLLADSSTKGSSPGSNPSLWDIHGGPTNADVHPSS